MSNSPQSYQRPGAKPGRGAPRGGYTNYTYQQPLQTPFYPPYQYGYSQPPYFQQQDPTFPRFPPQMVNQPMAQTSQPPVYVQNSHPSSLSPAKSSVLNPGAAPFTPKNLSKTQTEVKPGVASPQGVNQPPSNQDVEKQKEEERKRAQKEERERREKEERERQESEKAAREEKERAEREAREKAEREERERAEKERQEREKREQQEREKREQEEREKREQEEKEEREREARAAREREEHQRAEEEGPYDTEDSLEIEEDQNSDPGSEASKNSSESQSLGGKKMYSREFLLGFQNICRERPDSLPMVEAIVGINEDRQSSLLGQGRGSNNMPPRRGGGSGQRPQFPGGRGKNPPNARGPALKQRAPWGNKNDDDPLQKLKRNVTSLLNKITVEKFVEISDQILGVGIDSAKILDEVIGLAFQKAISEPHFANLYADLCVKLSKQCPGFDDPEAPTKKITFKRILLNRCQDEFEKKRKEEAAKEAAECKTEEEREENRFKQRRRTIGNIKFIGELYNRALLPTNVVANSIVPKLLHANSDSDELEGLCKFMKTSGKTLEASAAAANKATLSKFNEYFEMIESFSQDLKYDSRIRFMLQDILELRKNSWVPRREEKTAKKIKEIHQEAEEEENTNAALPVQPVAGYAGPNNYRRNDRPRGSPAPNNQFEKNRDMNRSSMVPKQPAQPIGAAKLQPQQPQQSQQPNLRPNSGKVWGQPPENPAPQKSVAPQKTGAVPPKMGPPSVTFDTPPTIESWEDLISPIFEEVFVNHEVADVAQDFKQQLAKINQPNSREFQIHLVFTGCLKALDSGAGTSGCLVKVFNELLRTEIININDLEEGLLKTRNQLDELKLDIPHAPFDFCQIISSLFYSESLEFLFFQKLYPSSDIDSRDIFIRMLSHLSKKETASWVPRLFDGKLQISSYFPTANDLLSQLFQRDAFYIFGKIPWDKTYPTDVKSGTILTWFSDQQNIEFENPESVHKFIKLFLIRATRDSPSQKTAWVKVDQTKKPEQEVIDAHSKLLSSLLSTSELQIDALDGIQQYSDASDKGLFERVVPIFCEKKIFSAESLTSWIESRGESLDAKLRASLNPLKGEILSKAS